MFLWLKKLFHRPQTSLREKWISGLLSFAIIFGLGFAGGRMDPKTWAFYEALVKPPFTPPNWVFPVAWTALFVLIAIAGYEAWNHYHSKWLRNAFAVLYAVNGILVYLWSFFFFERQLATDALVVIVGLILVIETMILVSFKNSHRAAYYLLPYLVWILFAAYLNVSIVALNP
jgi:translocator protein